MTLASCQQISNHVPLDAFSLQGLTNQSGRSKKDTSYYPGLGRQEEKIWKYMARMEFSKDLDIDYID